MSRLIPKVSAPLTTVPKELHTTWRKAVTRFVPDAEMARPASARALASMKTALSETAPLELREYSRARTFKTRKRIHDAELAAGYYTLPTGFGLDTSYSGRLWARALGVGIQMAAGLALIVQSGAAARWLLRS